MTIENPSIRMTIDQRRVDLLNDPNYGVILCFLDKYRSLLALPPYPFELLEDHLLRYQGQIPSRLIDLHYTLLKRISIGKNAQRDQFDSIIARFAARFDQNDHQHVFTTGYLQSDIQVKIRILKNLLESQFDSNPTFHNTFADQDLRSLPIGRDRFGADYWFFMNETGVVRLFREDVDADRTWSNVAQDHRELEKFIGLLISDSMVQRKFSDWTIVCPSFASLPLSDAFQQRYSSIESSEVFILRKCSTGSNCDAPCPLDESESDQTSVDDLSLAVRRSTRLRKASIIDSPSLRVSHRRKKRKKSTSSSDDTFSDLSSLDIEEDDTAHISTVMTLCNVCSTSERPEVLLLCDSCDDAYHLECLRPVLLSVPDGDWFCPLCEHRQLANCLMEKFQELIIYSQRMEMKKNTKRSVQRKIREKKYSSDESVTASESEMEIDPTSHSSDDPNNISQRGRHRRARFDMHQILDDQQTVDFDMKLPEKITRLLHRRDRTTEQPTKRRSTHSDHPSTDPCELNEILDCPLICATSQIARRWNDVQRRSRLKVINTQSAHPPLISPYTDENVHLDPDNSPCIESHHKSQGPTPLTSVDIFASRNILQKIDTTFDRLTRDIQFAVDEAHSVVPIEVKSSDQVQIKRIQKKFFSPFMTKSAHISLLSAGCQTPMFTQYRN